MGRGDGRGRASGSLLYGPRHPRPQHEGPTPRSLEAERKLLERGGLVFYDRPEPGWAHFFHHSPTGIEGYLTHHADGRAVLACGLTDLEVKQGLADPQHPLHELLERIEAGGGGDMHLEINFSQPQADDQNKEKFHDRLEALAPGGHWEVGDCQMDGGWADPCRPPQKVLSLLLGCAEQGAPRSLEELRGTRSGRADLDRLGDRIWVGLSAPIGDFLASTG